MADKDKLPEELRTLSGQVAELKQQAQNLADQVKRLEEFHKKMEPNMWFVTAARVILGIFGAALLGGIGEWR
jgi:hypothetical protein